MIRRIGVVCVWLSCGLISLVGCGDDSESPSVSATSQGDESFVVPNVAGLQEYAEGGKSDSVVGQNPVLHIEPDGEWHSINFMNVDVLAGPDHQVTVSSNARQGVGAVVIDGVNGPVRITMVAGGVYSANGIDTGYMPQWTLGHRLMDGQALVLDHVYRLPRDQDFRVDIPQEDHTNRFLEEPVDQREGFNRVELNKDQVTESLQVSFSFYNFSDSVLVMVEPVGWVLDEDVYKPKPDFESDEFLTLEEEQMQRSSHLLERLRKNNVALESAIEKVNAEIMKLEAQLHDKEQSMSTLVSKLDQREDELEAERERQKRDNLVLCAFGFCQVAVLSELTRDDSEYQQIKRDLESARQEHRRVKSDVQSYHTRRGRLELERLSLQLKIHNLRAELTVAPSIAEFDEKPSVVFVAHQISVTRELSARLKESYEVSLLIYDALVDIHWVLDDYIAELEDFNLYVEEYIDDSKEAHYRMLRKFLDPDFDADAWLEQEFQRRVGSMLPKLPRVEQELDTMLTSLVDQAVSDYFGDPNSAQAKMWRQSVLNGLKGSWQGQ